MKLAVVFTSLIAAVSAVTVTDVPASEFTLTTSTSCSGSRVEAGIASGKYVALPQASAAANQGGCGSFVFFLNQVDTSVSYTATLVDFTDDNVLLVSPVSMEEAAGDADTFTATYVVSPLVG
ncbi:hypothetical protein VKT23_019873 [Stygiomarasmius scandens]|uniref:Uncharacterized protein n=1 Tax=Marasmiellus scandens TaxID=2682957 RepID=A0ABR1IKL8_9AGAR